MTGALRKLMRDPRLDSIKAGILRVRGLLYYGQRYECPCCGSTLRGFVGRWGFIRATKDGYCPRCNAKARHRRIWLFLHDEVSVANGQGRILEIAPWPALARALRNRTPMEYVGVDLRHAGANVTVIGDLVALPFRSDEFDVVLCVHVLEHVDDDRSAIEALYDVVKPGGWALVSVPLQLDGLTYEDPSITDPEERARAFGERGHVRLYGRDIADRLTAAGFSVELDLATDIPADTVERFGLRDDEHIFRCEKPREASGSEHRHRHHD